MLKNIGVYALIMVICLCFKAQRPALLTPEFRNYLAARKADHDQGNTVTEDAGDYKISLSGGRLTVYGSEGSSVFRTKPEWYVETFKLGDINSDDVLDVVFVLWKSFSFGGEYPERMTNDDARVRCHLYVYSVRDNRARQLWCSSALPRPIYSFEIDMKGLKSPTLSGARLITREGEYQDDSGTTKYAECIYVWDGWGFSMDTLTNVGYRPQPI